MNITFSNYDFRIKKQDGMSFIFDILRKKFVVLTPEELVRQHWIHYLIANSLYPRSRIAVEMTIRLNQLVKRCDLVVFDKGGKPFLIVECKAPEIRITQKVFDQVARYNLSLQVNYLVVSNGNHHYACRIFWENKKYEFIRVLPTVEELQID